MSSFLTPPASLSHLLVPKDGRTLKVIRVARISTLNQDERSLDDQLELLRQAVARLYDGPIEYRDLATQGSGEQLDREELLQLEEWIESAAFDLVIAEDLARICRRAWAVDICELCEDRTTRLIALNDRVDTIDDSWRDGAFISSWHHERSNKDTSNRIKRSLRNRFLNGAILTDLGPFYVVPEGATSMEHVQKKENAEQIVAEGFRMLENGSSYSEVADWLNQVVKFPVGGSSRQGKWSGKLVRERFLHPRLKGCDTWNAKKTVRVNKTGRRKQVASAPDEILTRTLPHLAFIDADRFDRLSRQLAARNDMYHRSAADKQKDPLRGRAKKRTAFPGQMLHCGICGNKFVFGGHGQTEHLMCDGARQYACWNGSTVDGPLAAQKIAAAVFELYEKFPDFDATFRSLVNEEADLADADRQQRLQQLRSDARTCETRIANLVSFVTNGDTSKRIRQCLRESEGELDEINDEIWSIEATPSDRVEIPDAETLQLLARQVLQGDAPYSWEFNKIMRQLTPKIVVFPHRLIDGGHIVHRAWMRLHLGGILTDERSRDALRGPLQRDLCVDLFDPPQREQHREDVVRLRLSGQTERVVAQTLGITITATQRAAALQRMLDERQLTDPYRLVCQPPADMTKLRRHLHPRYDFRPLPEAGRIV